MNVKVNPPSCRYLLYFVPPFFLRVLSFLFSLTPLSSSSSPFLSPKAVKLISTENIEKGHLSPYAGVKLANAIAEAKAASDEFGGSSPEAAVAWDTVEELSATPHERGPILSDDNVKELQESMQALEEMQKKILSGK